VEIIELEPLQPIRRQGYEIMPYPVDHRGAPSLGYALIEEQRKGRFNPDLARELGVPEGPLWGQIHRGKAVTLPDGRVIDPTALVGPVRRGRKVVLTGDTRPCATTIDIAASADILVHEATFGDEEAQRAAETGHSTAREAATVARSAEVRRLVLTHFSARYSRDASELEREAKEVFANTLAARDGTEIEVAFEDATADWGLRAAEPGGAGR
jgi:ribonuclease Z